MTTSTYTAEDYLGALQALMPRGVAWPRGMDAAQTKVLLGLVQTFARSDERARQLLVDAFPQTAVELLPEWEASLGLPDCCGGDAGTITQRQARVVLKLQEPGGMSKPYFLNLASVLGYEDTTITETGPMTCESTCMSPVSDDDRWRFVWYVNLPHQGDNHTFFRADSRADDRVDVYALGTLECQFARLKPAHTYVIFTYEGLA